ncbi:hypothetical protein LA080_000309 [Diaporthe eres]|uniref:Uncharacterized protein n=1 Tax=Diaporthe vaccinii TaxID=105482 RepID=A0ABR4ER72_9PEZI|nr:hypothetical protein LA080_000309 [Diaporthe eres]
MAPYQMKATSKAKFQPRARRRTLAGRIEKQEKAGAQQVKKKSLAFLRTLAFHPKKDSSENVPTDQVKQDSFKKALADRVNEEALVSNTQTPTADTACPAENEDHPFKLRDGKRTILGSWKKEDKVAQALCADMKVIHKRNVQGVISPVFHQAAEMLDNGYMWGLAMREDITEEETRGFWERFLGKLWVDSAMKWPRKLSQAQFSRFICVLAEARWSEIHVPKTHGREPGLLIRHISLFLEAAERAGFPWAGAGEISFGDDHEE